MSTHEVVTYDCGYLITEDGDIATSDGKPRLVSDEHFRIAAERAAKAGKKTIEYVKRQGPDPVLSKQD